MKKELDDALVRDFPSLYRDRHGTHDKTLMCYGFAVGDGWEPLIRRLSEKIEPLVAGTPMCAVQVKQKFGGLRFYMTSTCEFMDAIDTFIREAEEESSKTCEECGQPGTVRTTRGWIHVICGSCKVPVR